MIEKIMVECSQTQSFMDIRQDIRDLRDHINSNDKSTQKIIGELSKSNAEIREKLFNGICDKITRIEAVVDSIAGRTGADQGWKKIAKQLAGTAFIVLLFGGILIAGLVVILGTESRQDIAEFIAMIIQAIVK
jgi:hypothetical protein